MHLSTARISRTCGPPSSSPSLERPAGAGAAAGAAAGADAGAAAAGAAVAAAAAVGAAVGAPDAAAGDPAAAVGAAAGAAVDAAPFVSASSDAAAGGSVLACCVSVMERCARVSARAARISRFFRVNLTNPQAFYVKSTRLKRMPHPLARLAALLGRDARDLRRQALLVQRMVAGSWRTPTTGRPVLVVIPAASNARGRGWPLRPQRARGDPISSRADSAARKLFFPPKPRRLTPRGHWRFCWAQIGPIQRRQRRQRCRHRRARSNVRRAELTRCMRRCVGVGVVRLVQPWSSRPKCRCAIWPPCLRGRRRRLIVRELARLRAECKEAQGRVNGSWEDFWARRRSCIATEERRRGGRRVGTKTAGRKCIFRLALHLITRSHDCLRLSLWLGVAQAAWARDPVRQLRDRFGRVPSLLLNRGGCAVSRLAPPRGLYSAYLRKQTTRFHSSWKT